MSPAQTAEVALCAQLLAQKSKSFRLATRLLPADVRDATVALYAWCRRCDDALDEPGSRGDEPALAVVARLRRELDGIYEGVPQQEPILAAFQRVVGRYAIPRLYPEELIAGMSMDARAARYGTLHELLLYCYRVAGTVGLMMCHVMGVADARALRNAAHLGIAMQLTNISRDVIEDMYLERLYLPANLLAEEGAASIDVAHPSFDELARPQNRASIARVTRRLLSEADRYYRSADRGLAALSFRCALAVRTARLLYAAIGARIAAQDFDPFRGRAYTPASWKIVLVLRALIASALELPRRALRRTSRVPCARVMRCEDVLPL